MQVCLLIEFWMVDLSRGCTSYTAVHECMCVCVCVLVTVNAYHQRHPLLPLCPFSEIQPAYLHAH